jgi:hypothetical protein
MIAIITIVLYTVLTIRTNVVRGGLTIGIPTNVPLCLMVAVATNIISAIVNFAATVMYVSPLCLMVAVATNIISAIVNFAATVYVSPTSIVKVITQIKEVVEQRKVIIRLQFIRRVTDRLVLPLLYITRQHLTHVLMDHHAGMISIVLAGLVA